MGISTIVIWDAETSYKGGRDLFWNDDAQEWGEIRYATKYDYQSMKNVSLSGDYVWTKVYIFEPKNNPGKLQYNILDTKTKGKSWSGRYVRP